MPEELSRDLDLKPADKVFVKLTGIGKLDTLVREGNAIGISRVESRLWQKDSMIRLEKAVVGGQVAVCHGSVFCYCPPPGPPTFNSFRSDSVSKTVSSVILINQHLLYAITLAIKVEDDPFFNIIRVINADVINPLITLCAINAILFQLSVSIPSRDVGAPLSIGDLRASDALLAIPIDVAARKVAVSTQPVDSDGVISLGGVGLCQQCRAGDWASDDVPGGEEIR
ncbi:MAG: hypothetical protein Q9159_003566 [Coniocarpon cinnabarinum]